MGKYTPGPWIPHRFITSDGTPYHTIISNNDAHIAEVIADTPQREANARLIAKAPVMYEELKQMLFGGDLTPEAINGYRIWFEGIADTIEGGE